MEMRFTASKSKVVLLFRPS